MIFSSKTHTGLIKEENQDSIGHKQYEDYNIFVVCDGIGGLPNGALASKTAVDVILNSFIQGHQQTIQSKLEQCMNIGQESVKNIYSKKMGTTAAVCVITKNTAFAAWCGDSRIYHLRNNSVFWISKDHNVLHDLLNKGLGKKGALQNSRALNRFFGMAPKAASDYHSFEIIKGDRILVCSDGLTNFLSETQIIDLITNNDPEDASNLLTYQLLSERIGAPDNFSWYIVEA